MATFRGFNGADKANFCHLKLLGKFRWEAALQETFGDKVPSCPSAPVGGAVAATAACMQVYHLSTQDDGVGSDRIDLT